MSGQNEEKVPEVMSEREIAKAMGGAAIVPSDKLFTTDELQAVETWDDLLGLMDSKGVSLDIADKVLGDGFAVLSTDKKMSMVGIPMFFVDWRFIDGDMGQFVSCRIAAKTGELPTDLKKYILNDGSTGIYKQLRQFTDATGKTAGLFARGGLRVSEYDFEDDNGVMRPAKTFYIDTSAPA